LVFRWWGKVHRENLPEVRRGENDSSASAGEKKKNDKKGENKIKEKREHGL